MILPRLFSLLLVLSLGLSTVGFGVARGQAPVAGEMVICTGQGIVTVSIDAEGNPVETHTLCPDAALGFLAAVSSEPPAASPLGVSVVRLDRSKQAQQHHASLLLTRGARGPPV